MKIRKIITNTEDLFSEEGRTTDLVLRKTAAIAVCANPYAGEYSEDLSDLIDGSVEIGQRIAQIAAELMAPYEVQSYGKGAIVGLSGEIEHAEAVLTTSFGDELRKAVGGGKAWICHMAKRGAAGSTIDIPLAHKDALTVRSHYDAMTIAISDAPFPDEIAIICCFANRGRLNHRIGGHAVSDIVGNDGLR